MLNIFSIRNFPQSFWKERLFYLLLLSFCLPCQLLSSPCVLLPCLVEYIEKIAESLKIHEDETESKIVSEWEEESSCIEDDQLPFVLEEKESDLLIKKSKAFQEEFQRKEKEKEACSYQIQKENPLLENQLPEKETSPVDLSSEKDANFFDHISVNKVENETDLLKWCKKTALLEKALIVLIDSPKKYFKGLSNEGKRYLEKRCCLVQSTALVISQTCKIDSSFPITGMMILSQFNEKIDGIFIDWMMIYPEQKILINLMNEEVNPLFFFHCLKKNKK